jgi:phenylacetate-CoA ligase
MKDHHIFDPVVETRPVAEQFALDRGSYRDQINYLFAHSEFYQQKFAEAGFSSPEQIGDLDDIAALPFTEKDEIRQSQANYPPFGNHIATRIPASCV